MNFSKISKAIRFANRLYDVYPAGGPLHCLLHDGNLHDSVCTTDGLGSWYNPTEKQARKDKLCAMAWARLTLEERQAAYNLFWNLSHGRIQIHRAAVSYAGGIAVESEAEIPTRDHVRLLILIGAHTWKK